MTAFSKVALGVGIALALAAMLTGTLGAALVPVTRVSSGPKPTPAPDPVAADGLTDGTWFGWVRVEVTDGSVQLLIDPADMLTGERARAAAVAAGVIAPHEDLPNDFFIDNPTRDVFRHLVTGDATLIVRSAVDPAEDISLTPADFHRLFEGTYEGELIYGIIPGQSIPMNVTIVGGKVTAASQVYLP